jgi:tripartite-type tricarboxylate transporter receptor subunit TctC
MWSLRYWRCVASTLLLLTFMFCSGSAGAQQYPARPISFVVAFAPGGVADVLARLIARGLESRLGQPVVVENRPGAGGNIAATIVSHAAPDGYTLLLTTTAFAINLTLNKNKKFTVDDFATVAITASSPEVLVVNPRNPAHDLAEFVKAAKGTSINFGTAGVGSASHIVAEYFFKKIANVSVVHIPYQGGAPAINALLGNQIDLMAAILGGGVATQIAAGNLMGLAVASDKRVAVVPNVPTYVESGFPNFEAADWVGVFAPAKTDPTIVAKLNAAVEQVIKDPEVLNKLNTIGFDPMNGTSAQADAYFKAEVAKWGAMVNALGLSIN